MNIFEYLKLLGITIDDSNSSLVLFSVSVLILTVIALLCFMNIIIYVSIIWLLNNHESKVNTWLSSLSNNLWKRFIIKFINLYKTTRMFYIYLEVFLFIYCLGMVIWMSLQIIYHLSV